MATEASSVKATSKACEYAALRSSALKSCGVCAPKILERSTLSPTLSARISFPRSSRTLSSTFSVSTIGTTGIRALILPDSIFSNIPRTRLSETSGRTPSWIATTESSGTWARAFLTEWKRVIPPVTMVCGQ